MSGKVVPCPEYGCMLKRGHWGVCARAAPAPTGTKADAGKPDYSLLPPRAVDSVVRVLSFGSRKYGAENWRHVEGRKTRYLSAALRHVFARMRGEQNDAESGESHLAHAACCLLFLLDEEDGSTP